MKLNTTALSTVETGFPLLAAGRYFARIESLEEKSTKDQKGTYINIKLKLHGAELPKHSGGFVKNNGLCLFRGISQVTTYNDDGSVKYDPNKNWKEVAIAVGFEGDEITPEDIIGKDIAIVVAYKAAEGSYREANEVSWFQKITDKDQFNPSF